MTTASPVQPAYKKADRAPTSEITRNVDPGTDLRSYGEQFLTVVILLFGVVALGLLYKLIVSRAATPFLMRIYVVVILVFGTLLVVSSSYSTSQIAPVVGFFGTIAGYLLGRSDRGRDQDDRQAP